MHVWEVVATVRADGANLEVAKGKEGNGPVRLQDRRADGVGQEVAKQVFRDAAVRRAEADGRRERVVLLVVGCVQRRRMESLVAVKEEASSALHDGNGREKRVRSSHEVESNFSAEL